MQYKYVFHDLIKLYNTYSQNIDDFGLFISIFSFLLELRNSLLYLACLGKHFICVDHL